MTSRVATLFFLLATVAGALLLLFGVWIFVIAAIPSPTTMGCGALALVLTGLAWRAHRRARAAEADD